MRELAIAEVQGLHSAIAALGDRDVPPATGLTLAKARRQLQDHLQDYHSVRRDILEKYGEVPILPLPSDLLDGVSDLPYSIVDTLALYMED